MNMPMYQIDSHGKKNLPRCTGHIWPQPPAVHLVYIVWFVYVRTMFVEFIHFVCFWLKRTPDGWCSSPRLKEPGMDTILQRIAKVLNVAKFPNAPSLSTPFSFPCRPYCIDRYWYPLSELKHVETATCCCGFCPSVISSKMKVLTS